MKVEGKMWKEKFVKKAEMYLQCCACVRLQARITRMTLPTIRADRSSLQAGDRGRYGEGWTQTCCMCIVIYVFLYERFVVQSGKKEARVLYVCVDKDDEEGRNEMARN